MRSSLQRYVRHFPVNTGKERLVSLLWKPLVPRDGLVETRLLKADVRLTCDLGQFIQRHVFFFGSYEREACELWVECAKRAAVIFDVGANIGVYSLLAATANSKARVHAFEPTPEVLTTFQQNVELNKLPNIIINAIAVGKQNGTASLHKCRGVDGSNEGMNFITENDGLQPEAEETVRLVSLNAYCETNGIEQIDLMKIDIEGGEYNAFVGAESLIRKQAIKCIFFGLSEWAANRNGHSTRDIKRLLLDAGYRLSEVRGRRLSPLGVAGSNNISTAVALARDCTFLTSLSQ